MDSKPVKSIWPSQLQTEPKPWKAVYMREEHSKLKSLLCTVIRYYVNTTSQGGQFLEEANGQNGRPSRQAQPSPDTTRSNHKCLVPWISIVVKCIDEWLHQILKTKTCSDDRVNRDLALRWSPEWRWKYPYGAPMSWRLGEVTSLWVPGTYECSEQQANRKNWSMR